MLVALLLLGDAGLSATRFLNRLANPGADKNAAIKETSFTLPLEANGRFSLDNVNGQIEITGWNRNEVVVKSTIHGSDQEAVDAVKTDVECDSNHIVIHTRQPSNRGGFFSWFKHRRETQVDYTVQVPQQARLPNIASVNGRIVIQGMGSDIGASTVNGRTEVKGAAGNLKLSTVNGKIVAELISLGPGQSVSLSTVNGHVEAFLPANASAHVSASTVNGGITSEFASLTPKKEFPVGSELSGSLGAGGGSIKATTVNGGIGFRRSKVSPVGTEASQPEVDDAAKAK